MSRKKSAALCISLILVLGVFAVLAVKITTSESGSAKAEGITAEGITAQGITAQGITAEDITAEAASEPAESSENGISAAALKDGGAEALIGETLSKEEIEGNLGKYEKFEMSSDGCERGVYAGRFYYDGFTIFSRTYNKGKTFHIVSIN